MIKPELLTQRDQTCDRQEPEWDWHGSPHDRLMRAHNHFRTNKLHTAACVCLCVCCPGQILFKRKKFIIILLMRTIAIWYCVYFSLENQHIRLSATVTDGTRLGFTLGCGASIYCLIYAETHFTGALHSSPYR